VRGDRADALVYARQHEALVRRELETDPDPDVRRIEAELRAMPAPVVARTPSDAVPVLSPAPELERVDGTIAEGPPVAQPLDLDRRAKPNRRSRAFAAVGAAAVLLLAVTAVFARPGTWLRGASVTPTFAVGFIQEDGVPDSLRMRRVLTDMVATNL